MLKKMEQRCMTYNFESYNIQSFIHSFTANFILLVGSVGGNLLNNANNLVQIHQTSLEPNVALMLQDRKQPLTASHRDACVVISLIENQNLFTKRFSVPS